MATLHIKGDLNFATIDKYLAEFKLLEDGGFKSLEEPFKVDFSEADTVDTAGVVFCLRIARALKLHNGRVELLQVSNRLKALLTEYKLTTMFDYEV